ncbi:MAG TPA: VTT domain-containing protein [Ktedonobacterales bacterium]|nr:VTT domain-containing protein [Ktedonobacterales bacterium]
MPPVARSRWGRFTIIALAVVLVTLGVALWAWYVGWTTLWGDTRAIFASPSAFRQWVGQFGAWAPAIYLLMVAAQVVISPIPGNIFPPVGAAAFGPGAALALLMGGMLLGSTVVFLLARHWGRPLATRLVGQATLDRYADVAVANGGFWLFLVFLLPLLPDDAVCVVAGLSRLSFRRFLALSFIGRMPGAALSVFASSQLLAAPIWAWLTVGVALLVTAALAIHYRARLEAWLLRRATNTPAH